MSAAAKHRSEEDIEAMRRPEIRTRGRRLSSWAPLVYVALLSGVPLAAQDWTVTTLAGLAGAPGSIDGAGAAARFNDPRGVAVDPSGAVFVADLENHTIRRVAADGTVTTFAGKAGTKGYQDGKGSDARFSSPIAIAADSAGFLYVADSGNNCIRKVAPDASVTTFAGRCGTAGFADGPAASALFDAPEALAVDAAKNLFVAEYFIDLGPLGKVGNGVIRKITPDGTVSLFAGQSKSPGNVDATGAAARFTGPRGIAIDASQNLFVADYGGSTIRKVTPDARVTTVAGSAGNAGSSDGSGSAARFYGPTGLVIDAAGNLWVADTLNDSLRRIGPAGDVSTPIGVSGASGSADGGGGVARFHHPVGLALTADGALLVADSANDTLRRAAPGGSALSYWTCLPSSARAPGQNAFWTTDLSIFNSSPSSATVVVKFLGHGGDGGNGPEQTIALPPLSGRSIPDVLAALFNRSTDWGPLLVRSNTPGIVVQGQTSTPSPSAGTFGQSVPAMTVSEQLSAAPRSLVGLREDASFRTNVIFANAAAADATVRIVVRDATGKTLTSADVDVPGLGFKQLNLHNDLHVADADFATAQLSLVSSSGSVLVYASVIDNRTGDPRTVLPR